MFGIGQYVPFLDNANQLFQVRFCFSQVTAGKNIMITYIVVGSFVFPLAWLVDKIGFKRYFAILGMIIFVIGHFIILVYPQCVTDDLIIKWSGVSWGLFLIGIGYCFYATCLVSSVPMVVKPSVLGTAFGIVEML
jgi:MFS family permease